MGTSKYVTRDIQTSIKKIVPITFLNGEIRPVLELNHTLGQDKLDSIISRFDQIENTREGLPIVVVVEMDNEGSVLFKEIVLKKKNGKILRHIKCPSCNSKIVYPLMGHISGSKFCLNRLCHTRQRSSLHILAKIALGCDYSPYAFELFLNNFPMVDGTNISIDNLVDFKFAFFEVKSKDTAPRNELWLKKNLTVSSQLLWEYEVKLMDFFKSQIKDRKHFWSVANLDMNIIEVNSLVISELFFLSPEIFSPTSIEHIHDLNSLNEKIKVSSIIDANMTKLKELYSVFTMMDKGITLWI